MAGNAVKEPPTAADVDAAGPAVGAYLPPTPLLRCAPLAELLDCDYYVKCENLQPVGAFKVRGGINLLSRLGPEERRGGLISASEDSRKRKMPLLGNIPVLGHLFRNSRNVSDRKELLILLTPQILTVQPTELWEEDILDYSNKEIDESSMKDVFKDDKAKRAMFNRVFPAEGEPEDANPENPKPLKKQARPKPE